MALPPPLGTIEVTPRKGSTMRNTKLKRSMGLWMATALVVGNMIGSGVFLLPASLAGTAGPISMFGWVFTGAGAILLALVFAGLGRALPRTGGPYAYAKRAFGDFIGFQTAWGYWIAAWAGNAAIARDGVRSQSPRKRRACARGRSDDARFRGGQEEARCG